MKNILLTGAFLLNSCIIILAQNTTFNNVVMGTDFPAEGDKIKDNSLELQVDGHEHFPILMKLVVIILSRSDHLAQQ